MRDQATKTFRDAIIQGFPTLTVDDLSYLSEGKDSVAVLVNRRLLFRFPKHPLAEQKLRMEIALLPELAPSVPVLIPHFLPTPRLPVQAYPYLFACYEMLPGVPLQQYTPAIWDATWWQSGVGAFVTTLHRFPVEPATRVGVKEYTGATWREKYRAFYASVCRTVYPLIAPRQRIAISRYFEYFLGNPAHFTFTPVLLHADLHARHILLDVGARRVTGVIDFGECCIGDPAIDVRDAWLPYYDGMVDTTWHERRAFYYRLPTLVQVATAGDYGQEWVREGLATINRQWPDQHPSA